TGSAAVSSPTTTRTSPARRGSAGAMGRPPKAWSSSPYKSPVRRSSASTTPEERPAASSRSYVEAISAADGTATGDERTRGSVSPAGSTVMTRASAAWPAADGTEGDPADGDPAGIDTAS